MKLRRLQFQLPSLLLLPLMFALGWWARGVGFDREVRAAVDKLAIDSGGVYIPEMGIVYGGGMTARSYNAMSLKAKAEMDRRLKCYAEHFPRDDSPSDKD